MRASSFPNDIQRKDERSNNAVHSTPYSVTLCALALRAARSAPLPVVSDGRRSKMKILLLLFAVLGLIGCGDGSDSRYYHSFELDESTFDAEAMQMIERDTGLDIPDNARGLNFAYKPPIDPAFLARIEIPAESLELMKKQLDVLKEKKIGTSGGLRERTPWWRPSQGTILIDKQVWDSSDGSLLHTVLATEDGKFILYIDHAT